LILAVWGLKDEDLYWGEVAVCTGVIGLSWLVCYLADWPAYYTTVPTVIVDVWLLVKLDMLTVNVPR
jgi:hypothetical protein